MLKLNNLKSPRGAHKNIKRIGRGHGSGQGQQAGKGHKGQKARSGGGVRLGFEGGSMPLYMRMPKKGFSNAPFKTEYALINLSQIVEKFTQGEEINRESLIAKGLLKGRLKKQPIKILGNLKEGQTVDQGYQFVGIKKVSQSALDAIEKAGGSLK